MRYDIEVGGRTRQVVVTRTGEAFAVQVGGRTFQVDAARIDAHSLSLVVDRVWSNDTGASYEVAVEPDGATGDVIAHVAGTAIPVRLHGRRRSGRKEEGAAAGTGPQRLVAPMPGKIVRVLVARGDAVRARQPLVVVEAMKMENELRAARDGTVAEVHAKEGQSVEAGALLIVIQ